MPKLVLSSLIILALLQAAPGALAQDKQEKVDPTKIDEIKKTETVPPATGKSLPEQAGAQEPSSKTPGTSKNIDAFVNGVLAVPGIPAESETAPAKHSPRVAADDRLPIAAYRLRRLDEAQRREVAQQLAGPRRIAPAGGSEAADDAQVVVGALVPATALDALIPVPEAVATKFAELRGAGYMRAAGKLVLIDLRNRLVIGVLDK